MWFAKWFGGRNDEQDDEPARVPPGTVRVSQTAPKSRPAERQSRTSASIKKGFDPYNSGAFERANAWERTNRR